MAATAAVPAPKRVLVLKDEPLTRIELIEDRGVLRKTYRARPFLLWRTFLMRSRAAREFAALSVAESRAVPCVEPVAFGERRWCGCVPTCWIETRWVPRCRDLRELLREAATRGRAGAVQRRRLASRAGHLYARVHRAGILWCTLTSRNVLVQGEPDEGRLLVCDLPGAQCFARSIFAGRLARIDLWDACASDSRRREFTGPDRFALLLAYCDGDRPAARRLWRLLMRRGRRCNRGEKGLARGVFGCLAALRRWWGRSRATVVP